MNTVEFARLVAEIVSRHILNAVCGGSEVSPKADDGGIAERLLKELLSYTGAADEGTLNHTHGDHIRSGVVNAVAELLITAKETGGLPGNVNATKTTLNPEAEAERRRRGAAAAALLASGKHKYNYCDTIQSNRRAQTSQNKKYEVPKFVRRKSNYKYTEATAEDEKRTSQDGVKNKANSRAVIKARVRPKLDKLGNGKEEGTENTKNVTRNVRLKKTIDSRTDQNRPTNVIKTNQSSKLEARKTVGEGVKFRNSRNILAIKTRDRIPRQVAISDNVVKNTKSIKQSKVVSDVSSQLQKNILKRKAAVVVEPDKTRKVQIEKTIGSLTHQKRPTNGNRTKNASKVDAQKTVGEDAKSGINKIGDNFENNMRSQKRSNARKTVSAFTTDNNRKSGTTGALLKEVVKTSGTRGKIDPPEDAEENNKHRKLINSKRNSLGTNSVVEKSKTTGTRNISSVVKKSKNLTTRNDVVKPRVFEKRDETTLLKTSARNGINELVDTAETIETSGTSTDVRYDDGGGGGKKTVLSETQISPAIDYHDDTSLTDTRDRINDTKKIFSVSETIGSLGISADVRDDDGGGGGKKMVLSENQISPAIDYRDDASLTDTRDGINESIDTKRIFSVAETIDSPRAPVDVRDDDGRETGRNRISERNQDETEHKTTKPTAVDGAGSRRTNNSCTDDDIYKLRMTCVVGQLDQCQNQVSYESY